MYYSPCTIHHVLFMNFLFSLMSFMNHRYVLLCMLMEVEPTEASYIFFMMGLMRIIISIAYRWICAKSTTRYYVLYWRVVMFILSSTECGITEGEGGGGEYNTILHIVQILFTFLCYHNLKRISIWWRWMLFTNDVFFFFSFHVCSYLFLLHVCNLYGT